MASVLKRMKDKLYYYVAEKNPDVNKEYGRYVYFHPEEHQSNRVKHWKMLLALNIHYRVLRRKGLLYGWSSAEPQPQPLIYYLPASPRLTVDELFEVLAEYEVISFDIFDTALYRRVEFPGDVFAIMSQEMKRSDFADIRRKAEATARRKKDLQKRTREIVIEDIYRELNTYYGVDLAWMEREIQLELELSVPNPYIFAVYERLLAAGKRIVFMSDMYLPRTVIEALLQNAGYNRYDKLYLSNEYEVNKGDGSLQKILLADYELFGIPEEAVYVPKSIPPEDEPDTAVNLIRKKINNTLKNNPEAEPVLRSFAVHVGDMEKSDILKSREAGLDAVLNLPPALTFREGNMDNLAGSFYRSIVSRYINNGLWNESLAYTHGFRVGGILAAGYIEYINQLVREKHIDKILFCARDCDILYKMYNRFYRECENEYVQISRYAIMRVTTERNLYDLSGRYIMRYFDQGKTSKTIATILTESGFDYLIEHLESADIDRFLFPSAINRDRFEHFIMDQKERIMEHNREEIAAAEKYYGELVGSAQNLLIVDVGWTGTCIDALKYFIEEHFPQSERKIYGALMCTSRNRTLTSSMMQYMNAYIYSPFHNMDLTRYMMPGGAASRDAKRMDQLHMPLEFLFTSTEQSTAGYALNADGTVRIEKINTAPANPGEIEEMQAGMLHFAEVFQKETAPYAAHCAITPYVAFSPLQDAIRRMPYIYEVYKDFAYDAFTAPFVARQRVSRFGELFNQNQIGTPLREGAAEEETRKTILFVTPELTYTGTPRSLLRMCKVAVKLGYRAVVWSAKDGPFRTEYDKNDIPVEIVPEGRLNASDTLARLNTFDMAVCNTIVTDKYARVCSGILPTVWYIREASNILEFTRNNPERQYTFAHSRDLYCVSDYAAKSIQMYAKYPVSVVRNSVEDEVEMAAGYCPGSGDTVKFVQFGTMEYRKGYDVLLAAYLAMPEEYQAKAELYFAGGFINSGSPYCAYLFNRMKGLKNVHYLGVVQGEEAKIQTLSQMDVVVVASRDESCSLVALEGAMLSKPLIVTKNVGAKYMVGPDNGLVVGTADVEDLKSAMMKMIDSRAVLSDMGQVSRNYYDKYASMEAYTKALKKMYAKTAEKGTLAFKYRLLRVRLENSDAARAKASHREKQQALARARANEDVIVSLTSHPGRIATVTPCIQSLLAQAGMPRKILLWLSLEQFPEKEHDLPEELLACTSNPAFEIRWVQEDLKPHKKYFYTMQEYPELPVIVVDDDVIYDPMLVSKLMNSYRKYPKSVSCMRANLMLFREDGTPRSYAFWPINYRILLDTPSWQLLPTGVGGVLYPPHAIPPEAFDREAIMENCLLCDDLWLKLFACYNGYSSVMPRDFCEYQDIQGTQETALWRTNVFQNNNDVALENIIRYFDRKDQSGQMLLAKMRQDRFC